jgi:hypothetical protein
MDLIFRALPAWPYPEQDAEPDLFKASYDITLANLRYEIESIRGRDPTPDQARAILRAFDEAAS